MRNEIIKEQLNQEISELLINTRENVNKAYDSNKDKYIFDFLQVMDDLLLKSVELQQEDKLKKLKYIWINCLKVSVETERYRYVIKAYDENIYLNNYEANVEYVPEYYLNYIEEDKEIIEKTVMRKIIRAKQYEVKDIQKWYIWENYIQEIPREMEEAVERIKELSGYKKIDKDTEVIICYGELFEYSKNEYCIK